MENFLTALGAFLVDPIGILYFMAALIGGLIFGSIPGLSTITLAAIVLPFTALMEPLHAIMVFAVMYVSGCYGGAVTAILFNIPGSPNNAPTVFDGYPMTLKGESGKAIGAAIMCSAIGGLASVILMMMATESIAEWALKTFGPPEVFALIFFGLVMVGAVGAKSTWKGLLSVSIGLMVATVGVDPAVGETRFDFGSSFLLGGIGFVPLVLGFFAISEVMVQGHRIAAGLRLPPKIGIAFPKFLEFWRLRYAMARSIFLGFFAGILPGIGAILAAFLSYSIAVRFSPHPERFGKGELEGVVASETANNAATGAAIIPLLALGLPGGALTAVMMGAFEIHGLEPGPLVFATNIELIWGIFVAMFLANIAIFGLGYFETKTIIHLLRIPFSLLAPSILLVSTIGAYALRNTLLDVWVMFIAGIAGYFLRRWGYSMAGIVIGAILGKLGESAFVKSMQLMEYNYLGFFERPIAATLIILAMLSVVYGAYRSVRKPRP
ncbi:MAG TPA: hypothetical protein DCS82_12825 [Rhodospirillaceae bacterium]|nr:hypothetical protein [Rhodospirillaceae bacterium]